MNNITSRPKEWLGTDLVAVTFCDVCQNLVGVLPVVGRRGGDFLTPVHLNRDKRTCRGSQERVHEFCMVSEEDLLSILPNDHFVEIIEIGMAGDVRYGLAT